MATYSNMKKKDVKIKGITYTVHATTDAGVERGIKQLKRDIKRMMDNEKKDKE